MNVVKVALIGVGVISMVAFCLLGVGFFLMTQPPEIVREIRLIAPTVADAERFDNHMEDFVEDVEQADDGEEVWLVLTEEEVTSKVSELIQGVDIPIEVKAVHINFEEGKVRILATVDVGMEVCVGGIASIEVDEQGKPQMIIEEIDIGGGISLPGGVKEQIANLIPSKEALTEYVAELPVTLSEIVIEEGYLAFAATPEISDFIGVLYS